jgi:hypothetical protein
LEIKSEKEASGAAAGTTAPAKVSLALSPKKEADPKAPSAPTKSGSEYPAIRSSTVDVSAEPVLESTGKSILKTDMDAGMSILGVAMGDSTDD